MTMNMGSFTLTNMWYAPQPAAKGDNIDLGYSANPNGQPIDKIAPMMKAMFQKMVGAQNMTGDGPESACN